MTAASVESLRLDRLEGIVRRLAVWAWGAAAAPDFPRMDYASPPVARETGLMLELAARGMWEAARKHAPVTRPGWDEAPQADREMAFDLAREVLKAVRDPDQDVLRAGYTAAKKAEDRHDPSNYTSEECTEAGFTAMIDAILSGGPGR